MLTPRTCRFSRTPSIPSYRGSILNRAGARPCPLRHALHRHACAGSRRPCFRSGTRRRMGRLRALSRCSHIGSCSGGPTSPFPRSTLRRCRLRSLDHVARHRRSRPRAYAAPRRRKPDGGLSPSARAPACAVQRIPQRSRTRSTLNIHRPSRRPRATSTRRRSNTKSPATPMLG